ncbi:MAG: Maf family protein [Planctomycetaceae bacterium]|nr:Maf family protein [Planctomycetaceae bacterium]
MGAPRYILGSRSPRRRELLAYLIPDDQIEVLAPPSTDEADFEGLSSWPGIRQRLVEIARHKAEQVARQAEGRLETSTIIAADTTVVASGGAESSTLEGCRTPLLSLGQPPEDDTWSEVVRSWFHDYYAGRTHWAATALVVRRPDGRAFCDVVSTAVTMRSDVDPLLDWYLATGEPRGKAGGYALQGAGSLFITRVDGSLSNVIGLPLERLREILLLEAQP